MTEDEAFIDVGIGLELGNVFDSIDKVAVTGRRDGIEALPEKSFSVRKAVTGAGRASHQMG